jgi:glutathione synthase
MPIRIALQMNALQQLSKTDSTLELARAATEAGHELFHYEPSYLRMDIAAGKRQIMARGHRLIFAKDAAEPWSLGDAADVDLSGFNVILMRQDPPFDLAYITATHILQHLTDKVRVVNDPVGVRNAPEKLLITDVPHLMPPTLIARDRVAIESFRDEHKDIIVKPLHGFAGHGIFHLRPGDDNLPGLLETLGAMNPEPWMIQKYLPIMEYGDKRIVVLDGEPVGLFRRFPAAGDVRGNMRVGGRPEKAELTKRDREICDTLAPILRQRGLFLVGLDVIGDYLTEINVTSPTGLIVADQLEGRTGKDRIAEQFWRKLLG